MGLAYVFALVVSLGVLVLQIALGAHGGGHQGDVGHALHMGHGHDQADAGETGFWTLFLSLRFWLFSALGFGLSGSLLHLLAAASPSVTFAIATMAGLTAGTSATLAFRLLKRGSAATEARTSQAVGRMGRVVVACGSGTTGQVRVEIGGNSVDLLATTDEDSIARGEAVLVLEVDEQVARVSRQPTELG